MGRLALAWVDWPSHIIGKLALALVDCPSHG
jgi:hypothetical protein